MKRLVLTLAACASAMASSPRAWEMNSYRDFLTGRFDGVALAKEGRLTLAPRVETLFASDQPIVWSVARASDGTIYAATGHRGRVFRIDPQGKSTLLWTAPEPEVFALALDARGILYAATSPNGKIYRIENGKAEEYYSPGETYIWGLAFGKDGTLFAATGDQGKIHRVTGAGQGEVWYETGQSHVTSLAFDSQGRLLAGSEPNGIVYRVAAKGKGFVLYDSDLPEIRTLVPASDGSVYAVALGGSLSRRQLGGVQSIQGVPSSASVTVTATTVSVDSADQAQQGNVQIKADAAKTQVAAPVTPATPAGAVEIPGIEKSAVYRIAPDNTVESLWSSKEENAYDLLVKGGELVIATDERGRIYRVDQNRRVTLLAQTNEGEATRLMASEKGVLAATGDMGKIVRLLEQTGTAGTYEAPVHDAATVARWGRLSWRGDIPDGTTVAFRTRSGNSARPDQTWSEWSEPLKDPKGSVIGSPNARYIQWRAEFSGSAGKAPSVDSVDLAYLPQNTPPVVRTVTAISQPGTGAAAAKTTATTAASQQTSAYSVTVTDTGEAAGTTSGGTPTQAMTRTSDNLQITWQADDPDLDRLVYAVYFRGEDEREWKLLRDRMSENVLTLDAESLADGRYLFRVVGSDSPANAPGSAREAELISSPTLIDHTPPAITAGQPSRSGDQVEVSWTAVDAASALRRAEYAVDGGEWVPVEPVDTVLDSTEEKFAVKLGKLAPGEHLIVFRAVDAAGNAGLAKVVLR